MTRRTRRHSHVDPVGEVIVGECLGLNGIDGPKAFKHLYEQAGPSKMLPMLFAKFLRFQQGTLPMAVFLSKMNGFFKYLIAAGRAYTDSDSLAAHVQVITSYRTAHS